MPTFGFPARLLFSSLFTFLCFSNPTLSYPSTNNGSIKSTETELNEICSQTDEPSICQRLFGYFLESKEASLKELCGIGLILGIEVSSIAQDWVKMDAQAERDPELRNKSEFCVKNYNIILYKFGTEACQAALNGKFDVVKSAASEAYIYSTRCSKLLTPDSVSGQASRHSGTVFRALVVIANKLF